MLRLVIRELYLGVVWFTVPVLYSIPYLNLLSCSKTRRGIKVDVYC